MVVLLASSAACHRRPSELVKESSDAANAPDAATARGGLDSGVSDESRGRAAYEPRLELVAIRVRGARDFVSLRMVDIGSRVLVSARTPVAWADGAGPLERDPRLTMGLDPGPPDLYGAEERTIHGLAGTYPDAVFAIYGFLPEARGVKFDLPVHRLTRSGWVVEGALRKGVVATNLVPFGARGVIVAGWTSDDDNSLPAPWSASRPAWFAVSSEEGAAPKPVQPTDIEGGTMRATRDGHVFVLGTRTSGNGIWLTHYVMQPTAQGPGTGAIVSRHVVPGTEACSAKKLQESGGVTMNLEVGEGGRAYAGIWYPNDSCPRMQPGLFEDRPKGLVRSPLSTVPLTSGHERSGVPQVLGVAADGTTWLTSDMSGGLWRAPPAIGDAGSTAPVAIAMPSLVQLPNLKSPRPLDVKLELDDGQVKSSRCEPKQVISRMVSGTEDIWVLARCMVARAEYEVVLRHGKPQDPIRVDETSSVDGGAQR
jgi:hypothetical protein